MPSKKSGQPRGSPTTSDENDDDFHDGDVEDHGEDGARRAHRNSIEFTPIEEEMLKARLDDWKTGSMEQRLAMISTLKSELVLTAPGRHNEHTNLQGSLVSWFASKTRLAPRPYRYRNNTTTRVIAHLYKAKIHQDILLKHGVKGGDKEFVGHQARAIKAIKDNMTAQEKLVVAQEVEAWKNLGVPKEVQWRNARKKMPPALFDFSRKFYHDFGIRLAFLATWREEDTKIRWGCFDYNHNLGEGKPSFTSERGRNWVSSDLGTQFKNYAMAYLTGDEAPQDSEDSEPEATVKNTNKKITLDVNEYGEPLLPKDALSRNKTSQDLEYRKAVIRAYLAGYWSLSAGKKVTSIPWGKVAQDTDQFFEASWWINEPFKDPSHISKEATGLLLEKWATSEANGERAFHFHSVLIGRQKIEAVKTLREQIGLTEVLDVRQLSEDELPAGPAEGIGRASPPPGPAERSDELSPPPAPKKPTRATKGHSRTASKVSRKPRQTTITTSDNNRNTQEQRSSFQDPSSSIAAESGPSFANASPDIQNASPHQTHCAGASTQSPHVSPVPSGAPGPSGPSGPTGPSFDLSNPVVQQALSALLSQAGLGGVMPHVPAATLSSSLPPLLPVTHQPSMQIDPTLLTTAKPFPTRSPNDEVPPGYTPVPLIPVNTDDQAEDTDQNQPRKSKRKSSSPLKKRLAEYVPHSDGRRVTALQRSPASGERSKKRPRSGGNVSSRKKVKQN